MISKCKNNKYEINASLLYKILYLFLGFMSFNSITANSTFLTYCSYFVVAIGACYFIFRLINFNAYKKTKGIILLSLFLLSYVLSSVITIKYGVSSNIKAIIWLGMQFFLLYAYDSNRTVEEIKREAIIIGWVIIGYTFIISLLGIGCFVLTYNHYEIVNGVPTITGFLWNRLWGFYSDPNYGAILSIISVVLSFFYILKYKGKVTIAFLIINVITEMFYITFSDSRTAQVSMAITLAWITVVFVRKVRFVEILKPFLRIIVIGGITLAVVISSFACLEGIKVAGNEYLSSVNNPDSVLFYWFDSEKRESYLPNAEIINDVEIDEFVVGRPIKDMGGEGGDISNRRFAIWKSAIEVFKTKIITGVSFRNVVPYAHEHLPETYIVNNNQTDFASMHNVFMDVLVSQGLLGIGLFIAFMIVALITVFKTLFKLGRQNYIFYGSILSVIVPIFVSSFFYSEILYINTSGAVIFWIALGYLMNLADKLQKEEICVK